MSAVLAPIHEACVAAKSWQTESENTTPGVTLVVTGAAQIEALGAGVIRGVFAMTTTDRPCASENVSPTKASDPLTKPGRESLSTQIGLTPPLRTSPTPGMSTYLQT